MKIPEIRTELYIIGNNLGGEIGERIIWLAQQTRRRKPVRMAPPRPEPDVTRAQIVAYFKTHSANNFQQAAEHFGVNMRKISYVFRGQRK